jgi:hypothetical protein
MNSPHRILLRSFLLTALLLLTTWLSAQDHLVRGKVTDKQHRKPLAFVNIVVNEGQYGGMSDIDGKYEIHSPEPVQTLRFSYLGYEPELRTLEPGTQRVDVALQPTTFELGEVTIEAGENPAHRILDSVMAHRKENNPNALDAYRYHIYDQMVFTIDSSEFNKASLAADRPPAMSQFDSLLKRSDLMIMETYSEVLFRAPDQLRQNVLGTKMSGSKNAQVVYLASKMQSTSFYEETVSVAGTDYVNPISRNSKNHYFFGLESVSPAGGTDSLYLISFHPLKGSGFNGLRGVMTIHSDGWALQNVKAEPDRQAELFTISIQQLYQKIEGRWFPKQLNTNLVLPQVALAMDDQAFPMMAVGKSYISEVELHPEFHKNDFSEVELMVPVEAAYRDDKFWTQHRIDSLTERILNTYHLMDSLTEGNDIFDRALNVTNKLLQESAVSLGPVDLQLGSMLRYSLLRGWYVGLHLATNDRFSRHLRFSGFNGFWTRLRDFDYGLEGKWLINRQRQMELGMRYAHRSNAMGEFGGFNEGVNLLSEKDYRYTFYENVLERGNRTEVFFNTRFARHFKAFVTGGVYDKHYHQSFYNTPADTMNAARYAMAELKVRFAYKEKFLGSTKGIQSLGTDYPIVWMTYQHAFKGVLGGEYDFDRVKLQVEKDFQTKYHGRFSVLMQAGYASMGCPVMETFNLLGSYERFGLYSPGCFATMRENEFFADRFTALFLSYHFQGTLWSPNSAWFQPQLTLATHLGWGDMKRGAWGSDRNFNTMERGFFESGVVVNGLLCLPTMKMGAGVFYRYGPYALPKKLDNFAFKYCVTFAF